MLEGMICRGNKFAARSSMAILLAGFASVATAIQAKAASAFSSADRPTPRINVRIYGFPGLSPWVLQGAEIEAKRLLRPVPIQLNWIDCTKQIVPASCMSPSLATDLIVRFIAKGLPQASARALGITDSSDHDAAAFIFYDRALALRTHTRPLPMIFGRVLAHEIMHLLFPKEGHSDVGLMRGQWTADDLSIAGSGRVSLDSIH
jgi:hypothetical protein